MLTIAIETIWKKYDEDQSGTLNQSEAKKLMLSSITELDAPADKKDDEHYYDDVFT